MKIKPAGHIEEISGVSSTLVYSTVKKTGRVHTRPYKKPTNPRSAEQQIIRTFMANATQNWKNLSPTQREAWLNYAKLFFTKDEDGEKVVPSGLATYMRANSGRQLLGLPLTTAAPVLAPPLPLLEIQQLGAQNPDSVGLTVVHSHTSLANHSIVVRMTPASFSPADAPREGEYRFVRGASVNSTVPLPASGTDVTFAPTRFIVNDGERYGVEARVLRTTDGLMSLPVYGDFFKLI